MPRFVDPSTSSCYGAARMRALFVVLLVTGCTGWLFGCSGEAAKHKAAGNVFFKQGKLDLAAAEYRAALSTAPSDVSAHTLLGNTLFEQQKYDEAEHEFQSAEAKAQVKGEHARAAVQGLATLRLRQ